VEDLAEKELADTDESQMNKVMSVFNGFLDNKFKSMKSISTVSSNNSNEETKETKETSRSEHSGGNDPLAKKKKDLMQSMGPSVYNFYYDFLYKARTNP
jgi:hypothetical protein